MEPVLGGPILLAATPPTEIGTQERWRTGWRTSGIAQSMNCPSPVCARCSSAARIAVATSLPAIRSITFTAVRIGMADPPQVLMRPDIPCMMKS